MTDIETVSATPLHRALWAFAVLAATVAAVTYALFVVDVFAHVCSVEAGR